MNLSRRLMLQQHHRCTAVTATTKLSTRHKFTFTICTDDRSHIVHPFMNQLVPIPSPAVGNATPPPAGSSGPAQTLDTTPHILLVLHMLTMPLPLDSRREDTNRCA